MCVDKNVLLINRTVWNTNVYMYKNGGGIYNLYWLMYNKTKPTTLKFDPRSIKYSGQLRYITKEPVLSHFLFFKYCHYI